MYFFFYKAHWAIRRIPNFITKVFKLKNNTKKRHHRTHPELRKTCLKFISITSEFAYNQASQKCHIVNNGVKVIGKHERTSFRSLTKAKLSYS